MDGERPGFSQGDLAALLFLEIYMSNGLPSFHIYSGDLWKDQQFQLCDWQSQNLWLRILILLHDSTPRGEFRQPNGEPMTDEQIAILCRMPMADFMAQSSKLYANGVAVRIAGAMANRRMVREREKDIERYIIKSEAGKKGAEARWGNNSRQVALVDAKSMARNGSSDISSSSSSSSSSSISSSISEETIIARFEQEFWKPYPDRDGKKIGKKEALAKYKLLSEQDHMLIAIAVKHLAAHPRSQDGIGIKDPHRWIRNGKGDEPWREWIEETPPTQNKKEGKHVGLDRKDYTKNTW